ncbi:hypothetical protein [Rhodococcus sp. ACT016]|uniref:hypothetical protein n=1 Tax=Rhodococcus sp. ACT016 TaxID=3134808 RepID=UPI003D298663
MRHTRSVRRWTYGVAAAPLFLFAVTLVIEEMSGNSRHLLHDVAANWMLALAFGSVVLVPAMLLAGYGGYLVAQTPHRPRFGRVVATIGLVVLAAPGLLGAADFVIALLAGRPEYPDDGTSWAPRLATAGEILFGAPFLLISAASVFALRVVWSARPTTVTVSS